MKKSDIERQLKKDLSASAPSDFNAVWSKCSTPSADGKELIVEPVPVTADGGRTKSAFSRGKTFAAVAAALILTAVLCLVLLLKPDGFVIPSQSGYFTIDVNPSVRVNYDGNGVVTAATGLNNDGQELLQGLELEGLTYDKAADEIFDACESRGYFSAEREDNAILATASKDSGEKDETITAAINEKLALKFEDKKMKGVVISDVDNAKGQKDADKYGISGQKYELIKHYLELGGELDESRYATVTIRELYSLITAIDKNSKDK